MTQVRHVKKYLLYIFVFVLKYDIVDIVSCLKNAYKSSFSSDTTIPVLGPRFQNNFLTEATVGGSNISTKRSLPQIHTA